MYSTNTFARSEMEYRANRIRNGVLGSRRGRVRAVTRRPAETSDHAR